LASVFAASLTCQLREQHRKYQTTWRDIGRDVIPDFQNGDPRTMRYDLTDEEWADIHVDVAEHNTFRIV
jgi:hypothetical protein